MVRKSQLPGFLLVTGLVTASLTLPPRLAAVPAAATYREPVVLSSQDGVLEVELTARPGDGQLDTVAKPVTNMLLFSYKVVKGRASNGQMSGENLYPAPTLNVQPGQTLIVHLENKLLNLAIDDFFDPAYIVPGQPVPLHPQPLSNAPFNLHTHGLHVSPMGNSDNVLLMMPPGARNTYSFKIPADHPQGMYWYHGHLHTLTSLQTYMGLAGMLVIGRADGNLPHHSLPVRNMAIQYNMVCDRQGGQHQLNNPTYPMWVSTLRKPKPGQLESGSYQPQLAPVNFPETKAGTQFLSNWYAGNLSIDNNRSQFGFMPNNLLDFQAEDGQKIPANPGLPDAARDVQFTVNGQFQPKIVSRPGQTEIWNLANLSDLAYVRVRLTETAGGQHPPIVIVGQDGLPYPEVQVSREQNGTILSIPPASRYAIAVTIPQAGELVLDMPPAHDLQKDYVKPGVVYTSQGPGKPPTGKLGTLTLDHKFVSYFDGFFVFPTQELLRAGAGQEPPVQPVVFQPGQKLGAHTSFFQTQGQAPDLKRRLLINGGFLDEKANSQDPKAFIYAFNSRAFPHTPVLRPRLNTVEEWSFLNYNNDEHPIHIHVNDFQVTKWVDPVAGERTDFQPWGQDNANVPAPKMGPREAVIAPGELVLRTRFQDFLGSYVMHCHRLNHEDNGLMAMVNVIPSISSFAVARQGTVQVRNGQGGAVLANVTPWPGYKGPLSLCMSDLDGDAVLDLVVGTGPGVPAQVVAYSGTDFHQELARFSPFAPDFQGGVQVAAGNLDGNPAVDNIVVGSGPGMESRVRIFSSTLPKVGEIPRIVGDFSPYAGQKNGVSLAVGMVENGSGLNSLITAPGPGQPATVRIFRYEIENPEFCAPTSGPKKIAEFAAFPRQYTGGVSLASDWTSADEGGAQMVVIGQRAGAGEVRIFSSGSALDGYPRMYQESPMAGHDGPIQFRQVLGFTPFQAGVSLATTSTTEGADLLVSGPNQVRKYQLRRAHPKANVLAAKLLGEVDSGPTATLGGD
ncbi:MAG: multicopper oxidase domain-containing protein [Candidatus Eremiobacteraeota bacterium]|nr:multicopper oxidase domain-containing protein [Candidatus Eremiobacteraeota bacterium]MCW5868573.1 multicopper oxidase domain-containing protein [Candidatus Eremiobacteraeota bacterium]